MVFEALDVIKLILWTMASGDMSVKLLMRNTDLTLLKISFKNQFCLKKKR